MERSESLASLTYKGSIPEAILEAKRQKKLFVVYISGEDVESKNLEDSTWTDLKVKQSLSKYCILLHIQGGSTDAQNFSAIYPQKSIPCITTIGYNGVQVLQTEGFVSAEVLASSLEKAWLSLHIQETTATVLTAALASKKYEPSTSVAASSRSEQGSSSTISVPSSTTNGVVRSLESQPAVSSGLVEGNSISENTVKQENDAELVENDSSASFSTNKVANMANVADEQCDTPNKATGTVVSSVKVGPAVSVSEYASSPAEDGCHAVKSIDHQSSVSSPVIAADTEKAMQYEKKNGINDEENGGSDNPAATNVPTDVHLNIRLPDGSSLQEKFYVADTLRMVKDYVDRNQSIGMGPYDLAIPYPRKLFRDQDLSKSLLDLGLLNRQALIVVPRQRTTGFHGERTSANQINSSCTEASTRSNGGYFAKIRGLLSYVNPFSYLGGGDSSSTAEQGSQSGIWEYSANPTLQNNLAGTSRPSASYSPNRGTSTVRDDSRNWRPTTSRVGSNIHTLKHDEDDDRFNDRNPFWNGNSTQYGGNSDGR